MKITDIVNESSTTSGCIAPGATAVLGTQTRNPSIYGGNKKPGSLFKGTKTKKPYVNSLEEAPVFKDKNAVIDYFVARAKKTGKISPDTAARQGAAAWERGYRGGPSQKSLPTPRPGGMSDIARGMTDDSDEEFIRTYGKSKDEMRSKLGDPSKSTVHEAHLEEDDLILLPGQGHRLKTGFHAFDPDKAEHEGETLKNSLRTIVRNAKELHDRLENSDQFPEWVSEKIGTIKGMMTAVTEYLISKQEPSESAGVIAGGGVGEGLEHGDHEISMAKSEMRSAAKSAKRIYQMLDNRDELMAWQQSYITLASDYLDSVADSMEEESHSELDEEGKGLWANIHAKRERIKHGSGERMRKPGSKGAPTAQNFRDAAK